MVEPPIRLARWGANFMLAKGETIYHSLSKGYKAVGHD